MKSRNQVAEIRRVQVLAMNRETMTITLSKPIEARGSEATAPRKQGPGSDYSRSANEGLCGNEVATPDAPAAVQKAVLDEPGIELLARDLQQFSSIGFVVAGGLQSPLDELAFGLLEGLGEASVNWRTGAAWTSA
jgi:hypothetical protein